MKERRSYGDLRTVGTVSKGDAGSFCAGIRHMESVAWLHEGIARLRTLLCVPARCRIRQGHFEGPQDTELHTAGPEIPIRTNEG